MTDERLPLSAHPSLAARAFEIIQEAILRGDYQPLQQLKEVELAATLGISRGPIREALTRLGEQGLVRSIPRRGMFVAEFSLEELVHLYEIREALEGATARLGAKRATPEEIATLERYLSETERILQSGEKVPYPMDMDFHQAITKTCHNQYFIDHVARIHPQMRRARTLSGYQPERARLAHEEHRAIVEAVKAREPELAERCVKIHLKNSLASVCSILHLSGDSPSPCESSEL